MSSNDSTAKEQSFLFNVNKIFLVIHLLMLFMFSSLGVDLMAGVSLISICFYFLAFSLTKSEKLSIYVYSVAVEILLHMILAVVCLGIQCNFQLFLIDAMFFLFAMDYVVLRKKKKNHVAILICCVYAIALIILYMLDGFYTPLYKLDSVVIKSISIAMISCAFSDIKLFVNKINPFLVILPHFIFPCTYGHCHPSAALRCPEGF